MTCPDIKALWDMCICLTAELEAGFRFLKHLTYTDLPSFGAVHRCSTRRQCWDAKEAAASIYASRSKAGSHFTVFVFSCLTEAVEWKVTLCNLFNWVTQLAFLPGGIIRSVSNE